MLEINYNSLNYFNFIEIIAAKLNTKVMDNFLEIPHAFGNGFMWAENFAEGFSVLVTNTTFNEEVVLQRTSADSNYFILQFNELPAGEKNSAKEQAGFHIYNMEKNSVFLTNTFIASKYYFPAEECTRSVNILFDKKYLLQFLDHVAADNFLSNYFSELFKKTNIEPVDSEYRVLMNELIRKKIEQPLKRQFIQNRAMLLLERFILRYAKKSEIKQYSSRISEDEITRLMKAEALLVKDFNKEPPNIASLSRMCAMSPTKLKKDFKSLYGLAVYEYYQKNRMMYARSLLLTKKYSVTEVGNMIGYTNLGHFAANFKKEFGMLPRQFSSIEKIQPENKMKNL